MDADLGFDESSKSRPKKGRRARASPQDVTASQSNESFEAAPATQAPQKSSRPSRRQTGWDTSAAEVFDSRLLRTEAESPEDLQVIPDLETLHDDDMEEEIAAPPTAVMATMATFKELDSDLMNRSAFRTLDGDIDLKILTKHLVSEVEVQEERDVVWEWEKIFA
uniref:Intraflagellar transport protein 43 homolog n=1 Tax=Ciona savignyi TaxID=51511 RepID=H2YH52_CIOSA